MKKFMRFLIPLILVVAIIATTGWYLFVYDREFTRDFLLSQARYNDQYGNSRLSAWFYNLAYEYSGSDANVAIELANQYKADGNYTKAEVTLSRAIREGATPELYTALCLTYVQQDKLLDAVNMLDNISNPTIKQTLDAMRPAAPVASHAAGFYSQYIDVELHSNAGTLYYTTDGTYPTVQGAIYEAPIALPGGETVIYAIAVADNGLVSQPTILGFTVGGVIEPAVFADDAMEKAIRLTLDVTESDILYTNEMWDITEFGVPEEAENLDDLSLMPNLKVLAIRNQDLEDLSCIASLTKLETLDLSGSSFPVEDLAILAKLPELENLSLADCGLSTLAGLEEADSLVTLNLSGNTLRNLEPLRNKEKLHEVNLQHNAVVGLEDLATLVNLEKLDISYNAVTDLGPLTSCLKLNWLDAGNNSLTTAYGLDKLPLLTWLSLDYNSLTEVAHLSKCTELTHLSIAHNQVVNIASLSELIKLELLDFSYNSVTELPVWKEGCALRTIDGSYNQLTSINGLATLADIAYVYMDYNALTNVDALGECYHLVQVNVYGNAIADVSALKAHDIIVNYDPTV